MMIEHYPDKWVILKCIDGEISYKRILTSGYGGYLGNNSWKLSSSISKFEETEKYYKFTTETNSIYNCHKEYYGMSADTSSVLISLIEKAKEKNVIINLLEFEEFKKL